MDPQSQAFNPYNPTTEPWRLQTDIARVQQIQAEHAERILRLERRQDDEARVKSVWGSTSQFSSTLSGTPQQAPVQQVPSDQFRNFDDGNQMMSSLHLDADEEPRRVLGAASRANSVRFDETANRDHFTHSSRPSMDIFSRTNSGLGGIQMTERTHSHKSDGRASSVHSIRSAASGRANSLNLDMTYALGDPSRSPLDAPTIAPGLMLLGPAPAIIRCWMNTNFKHDALLYAAVCTGSYQSFMSLRLIEKLGFEGIIRSHGNDPRTIQLPMFFPEAIPLPAFSRSSSPTPQLPSIVIKFQVIEDASLEHDVKSIQIFIGSDTLRAHNADILFSSNSIVMFDDDDHKLSIPLSRPESENVFKTLYTTSEFLQSVMPTASLIGQMTNIIDQGSIESSVVADSLDSQRNNDRLLIESSVETPAQPGAPGSDTGARPESRQSNGSRPSPTLASTTQSNLPDASSETTLQPRYQASSNSPAIWGNWRREGSSATSPNPSSLDWANAGKNRDVYHRKETSMKVLKPKTTSRAFSATGTPTTTAMTSSTDGKSRFFDEGRRRSGPETGTSKQSAVDAKRENTPDNNPTTTTIAAAAATPPVVSATTPKTKSNPIGGGSAFSWLNPSGR